MPPVWPFRGKNRDFPWALDIGHSTFYPHRLFCVIFAAFVCNMGLERLSSGNVLFGTEANL